MKTNLVLLGLILLIVLFAGCTQNQPPVPSECQGLSGGQKDICIERAAIKANNPAMCRNATYKDDCIVSVASTNNNWSACSTISLGYVANKCYFSAAVKTQDESYCSKMATSYNFDTAEKKIQECKANYMLFTGYGVNTCGRGTDRFDCCSDPSTKSSNPCK